MSFIPNIAQFDDDLMQLSKPVSKSYDASSGLIGKLHSKDAEERIRAARDLMFRPNSAEPLVDRLLIETELSVRQRIFASLIQMPGMATAGLVMGLLRIEDAHLRNEAIEVLSTMPEYIDPMMDELLKDKDPDVRILAVNMLGRLRHLRVMEWLATIVEFDPEVNVCATALDLLAEIGDPSSLPLLKRVCERFADEPYFQFVYRSKMVSSNGKTH